MKNKVEVAEHKDIIGQPLTEGSYIATCHRNTMFVCKIVKIHPKMVRAVRIELISKGHDGWLVYPADTVKLSGEEATAYILKNV